MPPDVGVAHARVSLAKTNVCSQEQRLLTLAKENQSPLGLYRNPPTFKLYRVVNDPIRGLSLLITPLTSLYILIPADPFKPET